MLGNTTTCVEKCIKHLGCIKSDELYRGSNLYEMYSNTINQVPISLLATDDKYIMYACNACIGLIKAEEMGQNLILICQYDIRGNDTDPRPSFKSKFCLIVTTGETEQSGKGKS